MGILSWIILGVVAGLLAGKFMEGDGYGFKAELVLGVAGAIVGGFLASKLFGLDVSGVNFTSILIAFIGACLIIAGSRTVAAMRAPM
jgi:uncharacterized membrane protein YeaQ/YmgE (transglycosylase-associated protein family)